MAGAARLADLTAAVNRESVLSCNVSSILSMAEIGDLQDFSVLVFSR